MIGLPTYDVFLCIEDWLKSKYSGEWVLVFDDVSDKTVFLSPFLRQLALPHTPTRRKLLDMLPHKQGCGILFMSEDEACLNEILNQSQEQIVELPPLSGPASVEILRNRNQIDQETVACSPKSTSCSSELAHLFVSNPVTLLQAAQQIDRGYRTINDFHQLAGPAQSHNSLVRPIISLSIHART